MKFKFDGSYIYSPKRTLHVMHANDFNQMTSDELREKLSELKKLKMQNAGKNQSRVNRLAHPSGEIRQTKKAIARIMTILVKRGERCV